MGPPRKIGKIWTFFGFFRPLEKMGPDGPKWGQEDFFPTNPDLADILGRTDLDFENFYLFFQFLDPKFLDFQVPDFQDLAPGRAWAMLEPSGPARALLRRGSAVAPGLQSW